jgi:hypothetical protein
MRRSKFSQSVGKHHVSRAVQKFCPSDLTLFVKAMASHSKVSGTPIGTTLDNSDGCLIVNQNPNARKFNPEI